MPLFGPSPEEDAAAQPMFDWINSLPPGDLAAELMAAFGGGGSLDAATIVNWLFDLHGYPRLRLGAGRFLPEVPGCQVLEAVQLLEHAELVYESHLVTQMRQEDLPYWKATRFGLATMASGKAAVRQRIKDRTGL